jgi:hypothetical protein
MHVVGPMKNGPCKFRIESRYTMKMLTDIFKTLVVQRDYSKFAAAWKGMTASITHHS